jgi:hypothetical protein
MKVPLLIHAYELSAKGRVDMLQLLFTRHLDFGVYKFDILDLLPLNLQISEFMKLFSVKEIPWRKKDWSESQEMEQVYDLFKDETKKPKITDLENFYVKRVKRLSAFGLISYSVELLKFAVDNGCLLDSMLKNFLVAELLAKNLIFVDIEALDSKSIFNLILSCRNLKYALDLGLHRNEVLDILICYCGEHPDQFEWILKELFNNDFEEYVSRKEFVLAVAYENLLIGLDDWDRYFKILNHKESVGWGDDSDLEFDDDVSSEYQELKSHLSLAQYFSKHGHNISLKECRNLKHLNTKAILSKLLRQSPLTKSYTDHEYTAMLTETLNFVDLGLLPLKRIEIYELIISIALSHMRYKFAQQLFFPQQGFPPISLEKTQEIIQNAALEFYDNDLDGNLQAGLLKESLNCLTLIKPTPEIQKFKDLIKATDILCTQYEMETKGTKITPIQIRTSPKNKLIEDLLQEQSWLYSDENVFTVAKLLQINDEIVLNSLIKASRKELDFGSSFRFCEQLIQLLELGKCVYDESFGDNVIALGSSNFDSRKRFWLVCEVIKYTKVNRIQQWRLLMEDIISCWVLDIKEEDDLKILIDDQVLLIETPQIFSQNTHDFYKPVGSTIDSYSSKTYFDSHEYDPRMLLLAQSQFLESNELRENLFQMGKLTMGGDVCLGILYLLASGQESEIEFEYFKSIDQNPTALQIASYYFALKAILSLNTSSPNNTTLNHTPSSDIINSSDIPQLETSFENLPKKVYDYFATKQVYSTDCMNYLKLSQSFHEKHLKTKTTHLREYFPSYDKTKIDDPIYRRLKILELAKTLNEKEFEIALELANEDSIPSNIVIESHLDYVFTLKINANQLQNVKKLLFEVNYLVRIYPEVLQTENLYAFYDLFLWRNAGLNEKDVEEIEKRMEIFSDLEQLGIDSQVNLWKIIKAQSNPLLFLEIWDLVGVFVGIHEFIKLLGKWDLCILNCLVENFVKVKNEDLVSEIVLKYLDSVEKTFKVFEDLMPILENIPDHQLSGLVLKITTGEFIKVSVDVRLYIVKQLSLRNDLLRHLEFIKSLTEIKDNHESVPRIVIECFDLAFMNEKEVSFN